MLSYRGEGNVELALRPHLENCAYFRFEDKKEVCAVVVVYAFARIAKILPAIDAVEPFAMNTLHTAITYN